jgi:hypothetical protein
MADGVLLYLFGDERDTEIIVDGSVGDVPWSSSNCAQEFRLESLENFSV